MRFSSYFVHKVALLYKMQSEKGDNSVNYKQKFAKR